MLNRERARFAALLVLSALLLVVGGGLAIGDDGTGEVRSVIGLSFFGCSCSNSMVPGGDDAIEPLDVSAQFSKTAYQPGERATVQLGATTIPEMGDDMGHCTVRVTLPSADCNPTFEGMQPDERDGRVFVFDNIQPQTDPATGITTVPMPNVTYTVQDGADKTSVAASVRYSADGETHWPGHVAVANVSSQGGSASKLRRNRPATDEAADLWTVDLWQVPPADMPLNQQEWDDTFGEDGAPFFALRFPLPEGESQETGWTLPIHYITSHPPTFSLYDTSQGTAVYSQTLEYRSEYIQLLIENLGADGDGGWCVLGLADGEPFELPENIDLPAGGWGIGLSLTLDLGVDRAETRDESVAFYFGIEGQGLAESGLDRLLSGVALASLPGQTRLWQGYGVSIVGPWSLRLVDRSGEGQDSPQVAVWESYSGRVEPGSRVQTSHLVENLAMVGIEVNLAVHTALGSAVGIYMADDLGRPYLNQPIDGPLSLDYFGSQWVALDGTIPEDARGVESWRLVAWVDGEDGHAEASDVFFVGEWMTPVPGEPVVTPTPTRTRPPSNPANDLFVPMIWR